MKNINNKSYIEVVGAESFAGDITTHPVQLMHWMESGSVRKFIDKGYARMFASVDHTTRWSKMAESEPFMYYCEDDRSVIHALDIVYSYTLDGSPVTAYDLIKKAQELIDDIIFDTQTAATALRRIGHVVANNDNTSNKYNIS